MKKVQKFQNDTIKFIFNITSVQNIILLLLIVWKSSFILLLKSDLSYLYGWGCAEGILLIARLNVGKTQKKNKQEK